MVEQGFCDGFFVARERQKTQIIGGTGADPLQTAEGGAEIAPDTERCKGYRLAIVVEHKHTSTPLRAHMAPPSLIPFPSLERRNICSSFLQRLPNRFKEFYGLAFTKLFNLQNSAPSVSLEGYLLDCTSKRPVRTGVPVGSEARTPNYRGRRWWRTQQPLAGPPPL